MSQSTVHMLNRDYKNPPPPPHPSRAEESKSQEVLECCALWCPSTYHLESTWYRSAWFPGALCLCHFGRLAVVVVSADQGAAVCIALGLPW